MLSRLSRDRRASTTALAVSREMAKHASLPRARQAVLVMVIIRNIEGHYTAGRPLSFRARPLCDVRAVTTSA